MILILGSQGMLGGELLNVFGSEALGWDRTDIDVTDYENLKLKVENLETRPEAIINCVAFNDVDGAEVKKEAAFKLNSEVPKFLAELCNELDIPLVHFSTNYVFDGEKGEYSEAGEAKPLSIYGQSKHAGELAVAKVCKKYYLVRTSVLFGKKGKSEEAKQSFIDLMSVLAEKQGEVKAVSDEVNTITYAFDLAQSIKVLLKQQFPYGTYHLTNSGQASWYDFAKEIFNIKKNPVSVIPVSSSEFPRAAKRPKKAVLLNNKFPTLRPWQEALSEFLLNPTP